MKILSTTLIKYLFGVIGIILISCAPVLFKLHHLFDFQLFFSTYSGVVKDFFTPAEWHLSYLALNTMETKYISFLEYFTGPYVYSMSILIASLLVSLIISFVVSILHSYQRAFQKNSLYRQQKFLSHFQIFHLYFLYK